jgi:hypothetical protein
MRRQLLWIIAVVLSCVLLLAPSALRAQSIGIFSDPVGANCNFTANFSVPFTLYINAVNSTLMPWGGLTGAEFKVTGMPPSWITIVTPNPLSTLVLGDPFDGVGVNIAFPVCQASFQVNLFTVTVVPLTVETEVTLTVTQRTPPLNPAYPCPLLTDCDIFFSIVCVDGGQGFINSSRYCNVPVEESTWGKIKELYRN